MEVATADPRLELPVNTNEIEILLLKGTYLKWNEAFLAYNWWMLQKRPFSTSLGHQQMKIHDKIRQNLQHAGNSR